MDLGGGGGVSHREDPRDPPVRVRDGFGVFEQVDRLQCREIAIRHRAQAPKGQLSITGTVENPDLDFASGFFPRLVSRINPHIRVQRVAINGRVQSDPVGLVDPDERLPVQAGVGRFAGGGIEAVTHLTGEIPHQPEWFGNGHWCRRPPGRRIRGERNAGGQHRVIFVIERIAHGAESEKRAGCLDGAIDGGGELTAKRMPSPPDRRSWVAKAALAGRRTDDCGIFEPPPPDNRHIVGEGGGEKRVRALDHLSIDRVAVVHEPIPGDLERVEIIHIANCGEFGEILVQIDDFGRLKALHGP